MPESVTVAICTWNRAALLHDTLTRLAALRVPPGLDWEVLVINNNSTDDTETVLARHLGAGVLPLRYEFEPKQGHVHARNRALDESRSDLIIWTDDDVDPDPGWLATACATFERHPRASAVGGHIDPWFPTEPDADLAAVFPPLRTGYCGVDHGPVERELGPNEWIYGANMAFRRAAVVGLRFDTRTGRSGVSLNSGDDIAYLEAVRARGGTVIWSPQMRLRHYVEPSRMTLAYLRRFYHDTARATVLAASEPPVPMLFGLPRWLVRQYAAATLKSWAGWLAGRRSRLAALREKWDLSGRISGYRALARGNRT